MTDPGDGTFLFTSESVGEGHPGEFDDTLVTISDNLGFSWGKT